MANVSLLIQETNSSSMDRPYNLLERLNEKQSSKEATSNMVNGNRIET